MFLKTVPIGLGPFWAHAMAVLANASFCSALDPDGSV